ncbi:uncharacterized protein HD556DRAFT_777664 [Suillus plorans]|uniref:Heterokaryon incompatibility domain-containing protein n=1 Tax=Suillus plorans TaxID=116603 RepID=A0A9P7DEQ6_9AGAM|nr:uncharacterized protein HD556DRAFT_777664 [Suillus plorans]KAG1789544.1 hypothetical protein HD556DRAFT_777664 [Suillus plorans]
MSEKGMSLFPSQTRQLVHETSARNLLHAIFQTSSRMAESPGATSIRAFEDHQGNVLAIAVSPDGGRMVTGSKDKTLRLWDLKNGLILKNMQGNRDCVWAVAISRDGQLITSGDDKGELIVWHGVTGESLTAIKAHSWSIFSMDFSPNSKVLATGSRDQTTKLWCTKTWKLQGNPIACRAVVYCVRYSPDGELLAIATFSDIQILNTRTRDCIANFRAAISPANNISLVWTPDGRQLLSAGSGSDPTIRCWDSLTWNQVDNPWSGHTKFINAIALNSAGTLVASASHDTYVRLWRLSDRRTLSVFKHSGAVCCVTFSADGKHLLSGGHNKKVLEWTVPEDALPVDVPMEHSLNIDTLRRDTPGGQRNNKPRALEPKILFMNTTIRNACLVGDLHIAEAMLTKEIDADGSNYNTYANHSVVMARKLDWDCALVDACKSVNIQPSLSGLISKGIALCGKMQFEDAMKAFDLAFTFTNEDSKTVHLLLLIKAIALFNANQRVDGMQRLQELAITCPNVDNIAYGVVEAYLLVRLGTGALDSGHHNEAADRFAEAVHAIGFSSESAIHSTYEDFVVLFGWDLKSLWQTAHQKWCEALLCAGRLIEAVRSFRYMMDASDETTKAACLDWSIAFRQNCSARYAANLDAALVASGNAVLAAGGDAALAADDYDRAIELYSAAIDLDSATDTIYANRGVAKSKKMLWEGAIVDAQAAIELNPSSYRGYEVKHMALCGAQRYDEAIEAFQNMLSKLEHSPDIQIQKLRQQYVDRSDVEVTIREIIESQLENAPLRLINTSSGRLCDRKAQISAFETSTEYKELVSSTTKHADLHKKRIKDVVAPYFHYVTLSHRWDRKEPLLRDIQEEDVYRLDPVDSVVKLQSFCKASRDAGYRWAWNDTCCIDKNNNAEVQESVNSMFIWYHHSALTIVYLSDVPPSSKSGALAKSEWNRRGWTFQEFVAPKVVLFYQKDWTLYLDDRSPNHKDSVAIMKELQDATGIDSRTLVAFRPGMSGVREKLRWASMRVTTIQEDIAYSLFGIFGIHLPVIYGEKKQNALGRLSQEIVAQSGDITALDWVGRSSEFNSCLPAEITSYTAPSCTLPSLSEDQFQETISSLRNTVSVDWASRLYSALNNLSAPRFSQRRLHLPCITFTVTESRRRRDQGEKTYFTYEVKAQGLHDLLITTEDKLVQFSPAKPILQTFLLVYPWNRRLLKLPDFAEPSDIWDSTQSEESFEDDMQSEEDCWEDTQSDKDCWDDTESEEGFWSAPQSPSHDLPVKLPEECWTESESHLQALQLIVRLGQPFGAFLLAQQRGGEYKRIASDHDIIAQVEDVASINEMMDIRTLEIL